AGERSRVPWTITSNSGRGDAAAWARRLSGTKAEVFPGPELIDDALPATGTTNIAASASMIMPRLPLPQSAFERDSPRRPQSAFARTPLRILRSCRINETPSALGIPRGPQSKGQLGKTQGR